MNKNIKGAILTMSGGICWGLSGSMGQYLFTNEGMDSKWLVPIRLGIAGLCMLVWCLFKEGKKLFAVFKNKKDLSLLAAYGLLGVSLSQFTYFLTIQLSSAGVGTIMQDLSPVMILMCSCVISKRKPHIYELAALFFALAGVFLIVTHGNINEFAVSPGALIAGIICAGCVTVYNMLTKTLTKKYSVESLQAWSFLAGGIVFFFILQSWKINYTPSFMGFVGIAFVVIVGNIMAFTFYIKGVSYIGPSSGILYGFAEPVTAALITALLMGSPFGIWDLLGFICIFVMLVLISVNNRKDSKQKLNSTK